MAKKNSVVKIAAFGIIIALPVILLLIFSPTKNLDENTSLTLPFFFPTVKNGDTLYHTIPEFSFISHLGETISNKTFENKIYITDFFYTTCPSICPVMTDNMAMLQKQFINSEDLYFLSHTVDPERDSVKTLKNYADERGVIPGKWHMVTGSKSELYRLAREGYYISAKENIDLPIEEDFIHSDRFVLVDRNRHIRGTYSGTDSSDMNKLMSDLVLLLSEQ